MPKGRKPQCKGELHYTFACPCMKGHVKQFSTETQRKLYTRLHNKNCKSPNSPEIYRSENYTSQSGDISQKVVF